MPVRVSSSGANAVISLVLPSTSTCPSTTRVCWSITASRCRPGRGSRPGRCGGSRAAVLPSTASTRRRPARARRGAQLLDEPADHGVEPVGVDVPHGAADRGLARAPLLRCRACRPPWRAGRRPTRRSRRTSAPRPRPRTPPRSAPRPGRWRIPRGLRGSTTCASDRPQGRGERDRIGQLHPAHLVGEGSDGQGCRRGHGSLPMIETGVRTAMITTRAVPAPRTSDRVSSQLSAYSPRLCRPPGPPPGTQTRSTSILISARALRSTEVAAQYVTNTQSVLDPTRDLGILAQKIKRRRCRPPR